jgi:hypothetical protein
MNKKLTKYEILRIDQIFEKYQEKVSLAHHNCMMVNEKQIEEIPCNPS